MGPRPMRCSSILHSSTHACRWAARTASTCSGSFFKSLLDFFISLGVLGTRHMGTVAHSLQGVPSSARVYWTAQSLLHPAGDFGPTPQSSICRRVLPGLHHFGLPFSPAQRLSSAPLIALIPASLLS